MADLWRPNASPEPSEETSSTSSAENTVLAQDVLAKDTVELPQAELDVHAYEPEHVGPFGRLRESWRAVQRWPIILMLASLFLGLSIVQLTFHFAHTIYRSMTWSQDITSFKTRIAKLEADINMLEDANKNVGSDEYMEQLARCEGFVKEDEQIIVAQNASEASGSTCVTHRVP